MAKTYAFRFNAQKASFNIPGLVSVAYGSDCQLSEEFHELTLADALNYLQTFSNAINVSHCAFLAMQYQNDRLPPGFKKAKTRIDCERIKPE